METKTKPVLERFEPLKIYGSGQKDCFVVDATFNFAKEEKSEMLKLAGYLSDKICGEKDMHEVKIEISKKPQMVVGEIEHLALAIKGFIFLDEKGERSIFLLGTINKRSEKVFDFVDSIGKEVKDNYQQIMLLMALRAGDSSYTH